MDFNILIGSIQIAIAAMQIKLDHFSRPSNRQRPIEIDELYKTEESIRLLEYALTETITHIGLENSREQNPRLSKLWKDASESIQNLKGNADLADIAYEKHLYWRNPEFHGFQGANELRRISLNNVLLQLRELRVKYNDLQNT